MEKIKAKDLFGKMWADAPEDLYLSSVETDSRRAREGSVFVAITGERMDGHDFAVSAFDRGAEVLLAERIVPLIDLNRTVIVPDILDAMIELGANYRARYNPKIIGVTGSVGKTSTKEFCAAILSEFGNTVSTYGNQNNEIGLPNTLFKFNKDTEYAVVEMGMQGLGEIHKLSMAAKPHAGIITSIGLAHIERLGTLENTLKAKLEICDGLPQGAPLVMFERDKYLRNADIPAHLKKIYVGMGDDDCEVRVRNVVREKNGQSFTLDCKDFGKFESFIPAPGNHLALDAAFAFSAAIYLGLDPEKAAKGLGNYRTTGMRQNIKVYKGIYMVEDCYNANPDSMRAAMSIMQEMEITGKKIAVLGDMMELGKSAIQEHKKVAGHCLEAGIDVMITVGSLAAITAAEAEYQDIKVHICSSNKEAAKVLKQIAEEGDAVLVKASRGMRFEEILEIFYEGQTIFY